MDMDMSQYLDVFLEESKEHLATLNEMLLELEKNPGNTESLREIFRAAHTLKGMSSTMGFDHMADLTHHMENLLTDLKEGLVDVAPEIIDVLFRCFDRLQSMVEEIEKGQVTYLDNSDLIGLLTDLKAGKKIELGSEEEKILTPALEEKPESKMETAAIEFNEYDLTVLKEVQQTGMQAYYIQVLVDEGCLMKSVRAFMVFKNLEEIGEIIKSQPPAQDLDEGKFDQEFSVVLVTREDESQIRKRIDSISEVKAGAVVKIRHDDLTFKVQDELPKEKVQVEDRLGKEQDSSSEIVSEDTLKTHKVRQTVRVDIEKLDSLMNLVGELVINKGRLEQIGASKGMPELTEAIEQMERISSELQNVVMKVRMVPVEHVFNRFPRMVRDLAKDLGKEVEFIVEGKETELDRTVIDEIGDPLVHLLRNAIDHGIESPQEREKKGKSRKGTVKLAAKHEGNNVFIEVEDDGRGLDLEEIRRKAVERGLVGEEESKNLTRDKLIGFLFESGFSTSHLVTDVSGRGVGLDVVKNKIESLGGEVFVDFQPGQGTKFRLRLPLTLAIIQALLVKVGPETYAIPLTAVDETTMVHPQEIKMVQNQEVVLLRGNVLPLIRADRVLEVPGGTQKEEEMYVVVVRKGGKQLGLVVNGLLGQQEIVIKSLGRLLAGIPGLAGATILGDGDVCLILDVGTLV